MYDTMRPDVRDLPPDSAYRSRCSLSTIGGVPVVGMRIVQTSDDPSEAEVTSARSISASSSEIRSSSRGANFWPANIAWLGEIATTLL